MSARACGAIVYPSHPELAIKGSWSPDRLRACGALDRLGYEQVPCATNWLPSYFDTPKNPVNYPMTVEYCRRTVSPRLLKGFVMETRANTLPERRSFWMEALDLVEKSLNVCRVKK